MTQEKYIIMLQILCVVFGSWLTYHGFWTVFSRKYYMRWGEGYFGENVDAEYEKLSRFHQYYGRYRWGGGALIMGVMAIVFFIWITFFS